MKLESLISTTGNRQNQYLCPFIPMQNSMIGCIEQENAKTILQFSFNKV